jgi:hypothetical protein
MTIKNILGLFPPVALYNIIARSIEAEERSRKQVVHTAVGWNPGGWKEDTRATASGEREFYTVVRKAVEPVVVVSLTGITTVLRRVNRALDEMEL